MPRWCGRGGACHSGAVVMQHVAAVWHTMLLRARRQYENRDYIIQESESEDFFSNARWVQVRLLGRSGGVEAPPTQASGPMDSLPTPFLLTKRRALAEQIFFNPNKVVFRSQIIHVTHNFDHFSTHTSHPIHQVNGDLTCIKIKVPKHLQQVSKTSKILESYACNMHVYATSKSTFATSR
jgi:hypothetical protein